MSNEEEVMDVVNDEQMDEDEDEDSNDEEGDEEEETSSTNNQQPKEVYLPTKSLEDGEELVCDQSAYVMLHQAQTGAPCLSFDIIKDNLGDDRCQFPLTSYIVSGTQAPQTHVNSVIVMKLSNLHRTSKENDDDSSDTDSESDESNDNKPKMTAALIKHQGCVNRIRSTRLNDKTYAAVWSELGRVNIFNLDYQLECVEDDKLLSKYNKDNASNTSPPVISFSGHQQEGYALDWCQTAPGTLATGDCKKDIHIWQPNEHSWSVDHKPLIGHLSSVEDLQWSPNERNVLASCSVDRSIRVWDTRAAAARACMITVDSSHDADVNVISWNRNEPFLVSGGDDGFLKIWDLRRLGDGQPVAIFKHHTAPVTSVEWHPSDSSVFASAGADNQIALWDLSVEKDNEQSDDIEGIPPQLLFIHQGQTDIKELHWHCQIPGVVISTAHSGFNIFRTISV